MKLKWAEQNIFRIFLSLIDPVTMSVSPKGAFSPPRSEELLGLFYWRWV